MTSYIKEAEDTGYDLDGAIKTLRSMESGEATNFYGIRVVRNACCYRLWSIKGMMRLGLDLDKAAVALAFITLSNSSSFEVRNSE